MKKIKCVFYASASIDSSIKERMYLIDRREHFKCKCKENMN